MLIEYTDKDIDRRDSLMEKYRNFSPDVWRKADSFEDAIELFEKYERTPDEMREFNEMWSGGDDTYGGEDFGTDPDDYDDEDDWLFEEDEDEGGW